LGNPPGRGAAGRLRRLLEHQCQTWRDAWERIAATGDGHDGNTITTDGPFVDTKEALNGYLIYEADDLDAAIELAARIPAARLGGAIEVRPIMEW